ncbi:hypothetical protein ACYFX5_03630 [Bremerella sp. T1]|uniref:hypothetical protein n=1 Tax=Bremerella sp. TYQ1 TaxID=3119568 RepID=UPI001CCF1638|nr:hypothetical protein [Bremerella volcania]UBM37362.1 hypothetical protein LA756_05585 [Bremerella volcania]
MEPLTACKLRAANEAAKQMLFDCHTIWTVCKSGFGQHNLPEMASNLICLMNEHSWLFFNDELSSDFRRVSLQPVQQGGTSAPSAFALALKIVYLTYEMFEIPANERLVATDQVQNFPAPPWTFYIPLPALEQSIHVVVDDIVTCQFHNADVELLAAQMDLETDKAIRELPGDARGQIDAPIIDNHPDAADPVAIDLSKYTKKLTKDALRQILNCGKNEVNQNLREQFPEALIDGKLLDSLSDEDLKGRHDIRLPVMRMSALQRAIAGIKG